MITNLRRMNSRYRGPIESHKLSLFYQGIDSSLSSLKEQFYKQEKAIKRSKKLLLNRDVDCPYYITQVDYRNSYYGISMMHHVETVFNQIQCDWVGVMRHTVTLEPEVPYRPNTKTYPIQKIATLDRIFTSFDEFKITPGMIPVESLVYADLDRAEIEQEVS